MQEQYYKNLPNIKVHCFIVNPDEKEALLIKNPTISAAMFRATIERLKEKSIRVTPANFDEIFGKHDQQLELNLEGRVKEIKNK